MKLCKKYFKTQNGITLIELIIVIPLVAIIFLITYNMFFLTVKSFRDVRDGFNTSEDLRFFLNIIRKEVNQGKKAEEDRGVLYRVNEKEIYIYTDIDGDDIPEIVRYRLMNNKIIKDVKKASNEKYPYKFEKFFKDEQVVLSDIMNSDIFGDVEVVKATKSGQEGKDYRRKVKMKIEINKGKNSNPILIETYLVTKSRTEFE